MKVYALSSGSYSDYSVLAIFSTKKAAEEAKATPDPEGYGNDYNDIEEYELYDRVPAPVTTWTVMQDLWDDGTEGQYRAPTSRTTMPWSHYDTPLRRPASRFIRAPVHKGKGGRLEVMGPTRQGVLKVYSDKKAEWKARCG